MDKLQQLANDCMNELSSIGIKFTRPAAFRTHRSSNTYGNCSRGYYGSYVISINEKLLAKGSDSAIKETLMHELIHTIPDGMKHTGAWKMTAEIVNRRLGYHIKRTSSPEETGVDISAPTKVKYVIKCQDCGTTYNYTRHSKAITAVANHDDSVYCGRCKSHKLILI